MNDTVVVPDSIEPYIGYKALNLRPAADAVFLESPSQKMLWPQQKKAVARHPGQTTEWRWQLVPEDTPVTTFDPVFGPPPGYVPVFHPTQINSKNFYEAIIVNGQYYVPSSPPSGTPAEGMKWAWSESSHLVAQRGCSCGIYVVADMDEVLHYFNEVAVIVSVALWGTVTKASRGARGEFGYPQEIIAWSCKRDIAERVAAEYGIPIDRKHEFEKQLVRFGHRADYPGVTRARMAVRAPSVQAAVTFPPAERHPSKPVHQFPGRFIGLRLTAFGILTLLVSLPGGLLIGPLASIALSLVLLAGWLLYMKQLFK